MIIAGGVYLETCVTPETRQLLGSAGRAALGLSSLRSDIELHTFHPPDLWGDLEANFSPYGIDCRPTASSQRVEFAYLFPLARPVQIPACVTERGATLVAGDKVLRFGCAEGDFIVKAGQAVFDPQGTASWQFRDRGGTAERLALVLNASEALASTGNDSIHMAAHAILASEKAEVVVVKDGPHGAHVYSSGQVHHVPAYASRSNYKIGSGDVFSAIFAHNWFAGISPAPAADHASRYTAAYVANPTLPFPETLPTLSPRRSTGVGRLILIAALDTVAGHWFANIVSAAVTRLGIADVKVIAIAQLLRDDALPVSQDDAILICAQDRPTALALARHGSVKGRAVTFFVDASLGMSQADIGEARMVNDLTQAIYETCWLPE